MAKTYLVECFWPGVTEAAHADALGRAEAAAHELSSSGRGIRFLGGLLMPADEVALYRFAADAKADVEEAGARAELPFERVVEYVEPFRSSLMVPEEGRTRRSGVTEDGGNPPS